MPSSDSTLGLLFKIRSDSTQAQQSFKQLESAYQKTVEALTGGATNIQRHLSNAFESVLQFASGNDQAAASAGKLGQSSNAAGSAGAAMGLALVGAAAGVVTALFAAAKATADFEGHLVDLSDKSGLTVETLSALDVAATLSGQSLEAVARASIILQKNLVEAQQGNQQLTATFKALNVDLRDSAEAALPKIFKALHDTDDQAHRTALAMQIFGRSGADLLPIIAALGGDLAEFTRKAREMGLVVGMDAAKAADDFGDQLTLLDLQLQGLKRTIGEQTIPAFIQLIGLINAVKVDPKGFGKDFLKDLFNPNLFADFDNTLARIHTQVAEAQSLAEDVKKAGASATDSLFQPKGGQDATRALQDRVKEIIKAVSSGAPRPLSAQEARSVLDARFKQDPALQQLAEQARLEQQNRETFDKLLNPSRKSGAGSNQAAQDRLRDLQATLRQEVEAYRAEAEGVKRSFEQRLLDEGDFTAQLKDIAEARFATVSKLLDKEAAFAQANLKGPKLAAELDRIKQERTSAERNLQRELEQIEADSFQRRTQFARQFAQAQADVELAAGQRRAAAIEDALDRAVLSYEEGERQISEIAIREIEIRLAAAQRELTQVIGNAEQHKLIEQQIAQLRIQLSGAQEERDRRVRDGRQRDLSQQREQLNLLRRLQSELARFQVERLGTFAGNDATVVRANAEIERQAANDRFKVIQEDLRRKLDINAIEANDDAAIREKKLANQKLLNQELEAEARRHQAELDLIDRNETVGVERATPGSFRNVFGDAPADALGEEGAKLEGFAAIVAGVKARIQGEFKELAASSQKPLQTLGGYVSQLGINLAQSGFAAFIAGKSISQAMRQAAVAGIAAIAQLAAVEAIKNLAWGLHAIGLTFLPGFQSAGGAVPNFFASAAAWGSIAVGAGLTAAALNRGTGGQGNGQNAGQAFQAAPGPPDQITFRRPLSVEEQERANLAQVLRAQAPGAGLLGSAFNRMADALDDIRNMVHTTSHEEIVTLGLQRNPRLAGQAVLQTVQEDGGFTRELGFGLRLG